MSKIVQAINVMVSNSQKITDVVKGANDTECFFKYDKKHLWSILKQDESHYYMAYYPGNQNIENLASISDEEWEMLPIDCVTYTSRELGTKEARESMAELFSIVNEKVHGMDEVLDDIIGTDLPF